MFLKAAFFGIALLGAISPSLAEQVDDGTKCAVVRDPMDPRLPGPNVGQIGGFIVQTFLAADRASGDVKVIKIERAVGWNRILMYTLAGCRDHPDTTVRDMAIETYERFRLLVETGAQPPKRESLRPLQIEAHIVSVEAVTEKNATDMGRVYDRRQRAMMKVTIATPVNLQELAGIPAAIDFGAGAFMCRDGRIDENRRLDLSVFFDDDGYLSPGRKKETASKESYTYRLYFDLQASYPPPPIPSAKPHFSYDLIKDPQDICLRLSGYSMPGNRAAFNDLRISEGMLRDAIKALK